jgi:hypothetical protein
MPDRRHRLEVLRGLASLHLVQLIPGIVFRAGRELPKTVQGIAEEPQRFRRTIILIWIYVANPLSRATLEAKASPLSSPFRFHFFLLLASRPEACKEKGRISAVKTAARLEEPLAALRALDLVEAEVI